MHAAMAMSHTERNFDRRLKLLEGRVQKVAWYLKIVDNTVKKLLVIVNQRLVDFEDKWPAFEERVVTRLVERVVRGNNDDEDDHDDDHDHDHDHDGDDATHTPPVPTRKSPAARNKLKGTSWSIGAIKKKEFHAV